MPPPAPPERTGRWVLWAAVLAALFAAFSPRDLWAPDEPRYGQVAREMLEHGQWVTPHANGKPYAEKPPLFFWLVAILSWPLGDVTAWSARLVGALFAAFCVPAIVRLARRWFADPAVGATAVAIFAANLLVAWNAPRAGLDLALTCMVLWSVERGEAWRRTGSVGAAAACGLFWAAAIMIKGPMGFLLPPLILAAAMIAVRRAPPRWNPGWWVAVLAMALPCLAWVVPALTGGDEAYRARLLGQIGGRISGQEGSHLRWVGYYVAVATPYLLPMTAFLVLGGAASLRPRRAEGEERAGLGAALLAGPILLVAMSLVRTKRDLYLIPGVPFAALAAAWALHRGTWPRLARIATVMLALACAGMALGLLALPFFERAMVRPESTAYREALDPVRWIPLVLAALLMAYAAVAAWRHLARPAEAVRRAAVPWLAAMAVVIVGHLPAIDRFESWQPPARAAEAAAGSGPIAFAGWYQGPNLLWALNRESIAPFPEADDPNLAPALATFLGADRPRAALVTTPKWWDRVQARAATEPAIAATVGAIRETYRDQTGQRVLIVLTNAPR